VGSAPISEAGRRADGGRAAWFIAELGPAGFLASQARQHVTRVGIARRAARRSLADVGLARCTRRSSRRRRAGSDMGIARAGLAARSAGAFMGRTAASVGPAARTRGGARAPSALNCSASCACPFLGRAGCTRALLGRSRANGGSATGRARETGFPDGALVEPAGSRLGLGQARERFGPGAVFERLGTTPARGGRAAANCRAVVGSARRSSCTQVGFMERAGRAGVGHAEDRRTGRTGGTFVGCACRATGRPVGGSSVEPAGSSDPNGGLVKPYGAARAARRTGGGGPPGHRGDDESRGSRSRT